MPARSDLATDPGVLADLAAVRLGTAYFRRALLHVADDDLAGPSLLDGWSRAALVAHVGYNARALARLVEWAATGVENPMYASPEVRNEEIAYGASLRPIALRNLAEHAAIDLDVRWRDLPDERWSWTVRTAQGREVPASETVWMRMREVWLHAVDLDSGARVRDVPAPVLERLLRDVVGMWSRRDAIEVAVVADDVQVGDPSSAQRVVKASLPDAVAWATGRGTLPGEDPAPRWL
ncbi:maleylpyruvate isomerase family mycothiol-dependent enzyme [uncultured Nocardioides sp.]|uniref:maleylpyruvate isomerase family mycothiol-dependent enzyme n=1 Tax=uncultured Nocardioides sp. TaxID=198441 RepID=UPI00262A5F61|nr:maleylpyruvate isomerase family mycothiol-dependent enzyme [uncultured Nocardioides sp.]